MSEQEPTTQTDVVETKQGAMVKCKSVRGSGTRDQDTVTVRQYYDDIDEAQRGTAGLTLTVRKHMKKLRKMDEDGRNV